MNFRYSDDNKRYHTLSFYNKNKYGFKVQKAAVNASLTCPNIDGRLGVGGCIYCESGSAYFTNKSLSIKQQIINEINRISKNNKFGKFIVYYQSNTNTYTDLKTLENMLSTACEFKEVIGVTLSTRADCVDDEILSLLCRYNKKIEVSLELGLQTVHNKTLKAINRCHTFEDFVKDYERIKKSGLKICIHIINGLIGEDRDMMMQTAKQVGKLSPDGLKIHMLHISKGTTLEKIYEQNPFELLSKEEYIDIVANQLRYIPPQTVIERLTGDGDKSKLIAPMWTADKISVLGGIDKRMNELDIYQGELT
ncbi:MAG: TIGR01212 family radical SAM protein [Clostridia bacterium]|nr:TIGR01212 family radical SAM protein [Clostridia bacterium]